MLEFGNGIKFFLLLSHVDAGERDTEVHTILLHIRISLYFVSKKHDFLLSFVVCVVLSNSSPDFLKVFGHLLLFCSFSAQSDL